MAAVRDSLGLGAIANNLALLKQMFKESGAIGLYAKLATFSDRADSAMEDRARPLCP